MKIRFLLPVLALASITGCRDVPQTVLDFNPRTGLVHLESPKQIKSEDFRAMISSNGTAVVAWKNLSSVNDADVLAEIARANGMMATSAVQIIHEASGLAKEVTKGAVEGGAASFPGVP